MRMQIPYLQKVFRVFCSSVQQRQRVVDILLSIMVEGTDYSPKQRGMLYTFLARQIARHSGTIQLNRMLFEKVCS